MKTKFLACLTMIVFLLGFSGAASAQSRIGFKLGGGLAYIGGGDLNKGLQGWSDIYEYTLVMSGASVSGGYQPVHLGMDLNGELLFQITPEIAIGLGAGYISAAKSSEMPITISSTNHLISWDPKATAIPITLNFHYFIAAGSSLRFVITAGVGYYLSKLDYTQLIDSESTQVKMSASGFGAHGGVGLEIGLSPNVAFVFDVIGRFASVTGFSGDYIYYGTTETGGKLWYYEVDIPSLGGNHPLISYDTDQPVGFLNTREAKLDLSGFSALAGFIFRF